MLTAVLWLGNISFTIIDNENHAEPVIDEGKDIISDIPYFHYQFVMLINKFIFLNFSMIHNIYFIDLVILANTNILGVR